MRGFRLAMVPVLFLWFVSPLRGADPRIHVVLWFDTEDYILPASDDAALQLADWLTREGIRATFKVVGEKARTLERRGRQDVIDALRKHEIGFHANWHSVQPSPAMYLANLGWHDGVDEFDRREGPGFLDVKRIFGQTPSCYGQPGSSWGPQSYGAMKRWGVGVYLDAGNHVRLEDKPFYYCGVLNLYRLAQTLRTGLADPRDLREAESRFLAARKSLAAEGGGIVSIYYHPCEFVHKEFWDGVNFRNGANPPRELWRLPPTKSPDETNQAWANFHGYIRFIRRFPEVRFITASEAVRLYRDRAQGHSYPVGELRALAVSAAEKVSFQTSAERSLAASEVLQLLNRYVAARARGEQPAAITLTGTPLGPLNAGQAMTESVVTDWSQFSRTVLDVSDQIERQGCVPSVIWLGSAAASPEAYLQALARVAIEFLDGRAPPESVRLAPTRLAAAAHVADDGPNLWGWVIFPRGFRAPVMMELAKRQAWTLKPALQDRSQGEP